jgi:hypothetical protein
MTDRVVAVRRRERNGVSRMIGRWPDGIRFEDAAVPIDGLLQRRVSRGGGRVARIKPRHRSGESRAVR